MKTIWKYPLGNPLRDRDSGAQFLWVPKGARFVSVINQRDVLTVYFLVDPTEEERRGTYIRIIGTGHNISDALGDPTFLGTVQQGAFAWHIFADLKEARL